MPTDFVKIKGEPLGRAVATVEGSADSGDRLVYGECQPVR